MINWVAIITGGAGAVINFVFCIYFWNRESEKDGRGNQKSHNPNTTLYLIGTFMICAFTMTAGLINCEIIPNFIPLVANLVR